ncbi:MAG: GNAT family N-acetyltransferase [Pseudobutyrivibrio ruminis]|uniref:GNAT family N-acetyltransferase n=1 Tax=Pseudobutyrivibrio ruminis TaxID=46206 RepID=UPI0026EFD80D|nr:GNAT family N-acetyltransferase [Pseudobutyrivibrio ruminis]MBE5913519.1 GNAT family N-acetyltransferase [Pseudobutyrivibrio ruminis]
MNHNFILESKRIILSSLEREDSEKYRLLRNRSDNCKYFFSNKEISAEDQDKWYQKYLNDESQIMFAICEKANGDFVGGICIYDIDGSKAEVGRIIIDRQKAGGKGYGAEAIKLINAFAKAELGLKMTYANIYATNIASIRSFENAGYTLVSEENGIKKMELNLGEK